MNETHISRPMSITVVGWLLIVFSLLVLLLTLNMRPIAANMIRIPVAFYVLIGAGILKGWNWARLGYLILGALGLTLSMFDNINLGTLIGVLSYIVFAIILFKDNAKDFFRKGNSQTEKITQNDDSNENEAQPIATAMIWKIIALIAIMIIILPLYAAISHTFIPFLTGHSTHGLTTLGGFLVHNLGLSYKTAQLFDFTLFTWPELFSMLVLEFITFHFGLRIIERSKAQEHSM